MLPLHRVHVVSVVLKVGLVETSPDSVVKKFLAVASLEGWDRVLIYRASRRCSWVTRNLETVEEADASGG